MGDKTTEKIISEYMRPIYGFVLKRTANIQDAEDLTQDICLKIYRALLVRDDINSVEKFVWTVAHNALANYYRGKPKSYFGNIDDIDEFYSNGDISPEESVIEDETAFKLRSEIAYLSKLQRKIVVLYYYAGKKQSEIAAILNIPLSTVKWHLSEAKNELKKGLDTMRNTNELKFNPIKFVLMGLAGSVGTMGGTQNFLRSALSQNIAYSVWRQAKTINQIADDLGVSPVYIESDAEFLEEYGFLTKQGNKYLANFLIDETTTEENAMQSRMYEHAAKLIANDLFDALISSEMLSEKGLCVPDNDKNFALWALIPYLCAVSGEHSMDQTISFEEAATVRPDGGVNIAYVSILDEGVIPPKYYDDMKRWCGPCWNGTPKTILWVIDSEWSTSRVDEAYAEYIERDIKLLERFADGESLSENDMAYMVQKGYIKKSGDRFELAIVRIADKDMKKRLLEIGDKVKEKHNAELTVLRDKYVKAILDGTPKQLLKMRGFCMQCIFFADGWFVLHCIMELVNSGKLKLPPEEQKKSLTMVMLPNK